MKDGQRQPNRLTAYLQARQVKEIQAILDRRGGYTSRATALAAQDLDTIEAAANRGFVPEGLKPNDSYKWQQFLNMSSSERELKRRGLNSWLMQKVLSLFAPRM